MSKNITEAELLIHMIQSYFDQEEVKSFLEDNDSFGNTINMGTGLDVLSFFLWKYKTIASNNEPLAQEIGSHFANNIQKYCKIQQKTITNLDEQGFTLLHWLVDSNSKMLSPKVMAKLHSVKDTCDKTGKTPFNWLFLYCMEPSRSQYLEDYIDMIEILIANGANDTISLQKGSVRTMENPYLALSQINHNMNFQNFMKFVTGMVNAGVRFTDPQDIILKLLFAASKKYQNLSADNEKLLVQFMESCLTKQYNPYYELQGSEEGLVSILAEFKSAALLQNFFNMVATESHHHDIADLINKSNSHGVTTLDWMFKYCDNSSNMQIFAAKWIEIAKTLLKNGADYNKSKEVIKQHQDKFESEQYEDWYGKVFSTDDETSGHPVMEMAGLTINEPNEALSHA